MAFPDAVVLFGTPRAFLLDMKTRILIVDDHEIVRRGLRVLLQGHEGWEICGEAVDGYDAVAKAAQLKPDLAILDVMLPEMNGIDATRIIRSEAPEAKIIALTIKKTLERDGIAH